MRSLLVTVMLCSLAPVLAQDEPLLRNASFEEVRDGAPVGWSVMGGRLDGTAVEVIEGGRSGERCLRLTDHIADPGGAAQAGVRQYGTVEGGHAYQFTIWVRNIEQAGPKSVSMQLRFLPSNQTTVAKIAPPADDRWRQYSVAGIAPEGSEQCQAYVYSETRATSVTLVDDAELIEVDTAALGSRFSCRVWGFEGLTEPRELNLRTPLVTGEELATIVAPADEAWAPAVRVLQNAIRERTGRELPVRTDWQRDERGEGTLIAIGNLNNNALIEQFYWNRYCHADALYPGAGEHVLRTIHEPYGFAARQNVLMIGASDAAGAIEGALALVEMLGDGPELSLEQPLLIVSTTEPMSEAERERVLGGKLVLDWFRDFYLAVYRYRDTGEIAHAERARDVLLACADRYEENPKFDITWPEETSSENVGAAWDIIEEAPVFTDEQRLRCENTLAVFLSMMTTHVYEWGRLHESESITWNHITYPLVGVYWLARHFDRFYGGLDDRTDQMLAEVHGCFRGQMKSWKPREDAMGYCTSSPRHTIEYSLAEGDYSFFESGHACTWAEYLVHCSNNYGDGSGFGDAGYSLAVYEIRGLPWALWYHKDGRYLWRMQQVREDGWDSPYDPSVKPIPWQELVGVTVVPLHEEVYNWTSSHGYYGQPTEVPNVPLARAFDKIALRASLEPDAPYMLIDGYSRGNHLQYDGNNITRYFADGEDWLIDDDYLVRNTTDHCMLSVIRDGRCAELEPPCAAVEHVADLPRAALLQTAVYDYNGVDWRRNLCWIKDRSFVLIDEMEAVAAGDYALDVIFKLLDRGEQHLVEGRSLVTTRRTGERIGTHGMVRIANPEPGVEVALKFDNAPAQLEFALDLAAGEYAVTTFARGRTSGSDSLFVSLDGGEQIGFHTPTGSFGPSSADHTGESPTPNVSIAEAGMHRFTLTLREGPGVLLDRIEIRNTQGILVHRVEAEDAPPVPAELLPPVDTHQFFIKGDGAVPASTSTRINAVGLGVRYLRDRLRQRLESGERCSVQNVFYNDTAEAPRDLDIMRLSDANCLIMKSGEPWGIFGSRAEELDLPEALRTDAALYLFTREFVCLARAARLGPAFLSAAPGSHEVDLTRDTLRAAGQEVQLAPIRETVAALLADAAARAQPTLGQIATAESVGFSPAWSLDAPPSETSQPEVSRLVPADLDGDGVDELIALRANFVLALDAGGAVIWEQTAGGRARAAAVGDLTGDGAPEVLVGCEDESVYVYSAGGDLLRHENVDVGLVRGSGSVKTPKVGAVAITDFEGDGEPDIMIGCLSGHLIRYNTDFEIQWMFPKVNHGTREMRFVDILGEGVKQVVLGDHYGAVLVIDAGGRRHGGAGSELGDVEFDVGDMDGDGRLEIINGSSTGRLVAWTQGERRPERTWGFDNFGYANADIVMADLTGDGLPEVLVASATGYLYALDAAGEALAQAALPDGATNLALLKRDGEVAEVLVACSDGSVLALDRGLEVVRRHRLGSAALWIEVLAGATPLVVVGCRDGSIHGLSLQ